MSDAPNEPMERRRVVVSVTVFFGLAFALTWGLQAPAALARVGAIHAEVDTWMPLAALGIFGPAVAAMLTTRLVLRRRVRDLLRSLVDWRARPTWYLAALLHPGLALFVPTVIAVALGADVAWWYYPLQPGLVIGALIVSTGEEIGWRGFALPVLQAEIGALGASVLIGVVWAVWHIPMFTIQAIPLSTAPAMILYFVFGSITFTWVYNRSGGSLLTAVLCHVGAHMNNATQPLPDNDLPIFLHMAGFCALALALLATDRRAFGRGPIPRTP